MSQRMTDEMLRRLKRSEDWGVLERGRALTEIDRARSEEARLLEENRALREENADVREANARYAQQVIAVSEENRKQAAQTRALADALHGALKDIRGRMGHRLLTQDGEWCACEDCARRVAALRLAGR